MKIVIPTESNHPNQQLIHAYQQLAEEIAGAEIAAHAINNSMIGQEFTLLKLSSISGKPVKECSIVIQQLSKYFLIADLGLQMHHQVFKIIIDSEKRIQSILATIKFTEQQFMSEICFLKDLKEHLEKQPTNQKDSSKS